jgi:hypothetical protein
MKSAVSFRNFGICWNFFAIYFPGFELSYFYNEQKVFFSKTKNIHWLRRMKPRKLFVTLAIICFIICSRSFKYAHWMVSNIQGLWFIPIIWGAVKKTYVLFILLCIHFFPLKNQCPHIWIIVDPHENCKQQKTNNSKNICWVLFRHIWWLKVVLRTKPWNFFSSFLLHSYFAL